MFRWNVSRLLAGLCLSVVVVACVHQLMLQALTGNLAECAQVRELSPDR